MRLTKTYSFIICNNGYTIERAVHETTENYNDILNWNYKELLRVFDRESKHSRAFEVHTQGEFKDLLADEKFSPYGGVQVSVEPSLCCRTSSDVGVAGRGVYA